jgi:hypothetical protein
MLLFSSLGKVSVIINNNVSEYFMEINIQNPSYGTEEK